jgi:uncharacterized protein with FMN-binding domain
MRRITLWLATTVTIVVLLFGYHTSTDKTSTAATPSTAGSTATSSPSGSSSSSPNTGSTGSGSGGSGSGGSGTTTYNGTVTQTRWGPVQVAITVEDGKVTKVTVLQQPDGNQRDQEINDYALPILEQEAVEAQSADIDMVSGATVTSDGYLQSLQGALDQAGL